MNAHSDNVVGGGAMADVCKNIAAICVWLGGVSLGDVQVAVSIITGAIVGIYSAVNLYVLWRDKIKGGS